MPYLLMNEKVIDGEDIGRLVFSCGRGVHRLRAKFAIQGVGTFLGLMETNIDIFCISATEGMVLHISLHVSK